MVPKSEAVQFAAIQREDMNEWAIPGGMVEFGKEVPDKTLKMFKALAEPQGWASDAERRGDTEQAMGWFADSMRLRDVIQTVTSIEIPLPGLADADDQQDGGADGEGGFSSEPPLAA